MNAAERRARNRQNRFYCAYCGEIARTRDHIPPKGMFGELLATNLAVNLITVPACAECNHPESRNDTYFRDSMVFMDTMEAPPIPDAVRDVVHRSIVRAGRSGHPFSKSARRVLRPRLGSGLLEQRFEVSFAWGRIKRTAERIVRGLYWHHTGARVPESFEVSVFGEGERAKFKQDQEDEFHELATASLAGEKRIVHPDVFMYSIARVREDPRMAVFVLAFYRKVIFLALVSERDETEPLVQ